MIELIEAESKVVAQIGIPGDPEVFTLSEAQALLPLVRGITETAYQSLELVSAQLNEMLVCDPRRGELSRNYETLVRCWVAKMERLGLTSSGLWRIDFDTGEGYLSWRLPELRIAYYRDYRTDFCRRQPLAAVIDQTAPDWA